MSSALSFRGNPLHNAFASNSNLWERDEETLTPTQTMEASEVWTLEPESELRVEVGFDASLSISLRRGTAEVLGVELALNRAYKLSGRKFAVFTWHGCEIETAGIAEVYKTGRGETTAPAALKVHSFLESRREAAARDATLEVVGGVYGGSLFEKPSVLTESTREFYQPNASRGGPRVMAVGPTDSGKSTLCKTLAAYAARAGREPVFVDLDPCLGDAGGPPGSIAAVRVDLDSLDVESPSYGTSVESSDPPYSCWFGYDSPADNAELYRHVVDRVAVAVAERLSTDRPARSAGLLVNSCGGGFDAKGNGLASLKHAIASFNIDVILVLAHDKIYQELKASVPPDVVVANLPRSRGVVDRDQSYRRRDRHKRIHQYFYGNPLNDLPLAPSTLELRFRDCRIFKVLARDAAAVDSMLPVGQGSMLEPLQVVAVPPSTALVHNFLVACHKSPHHATSSNYAADNAALGNTTTTAGLPLDQTPSTTSSSSSSSNPYQFLLDCAAAGFVVITNVNMDRGTLTLLTPCSGDLPTNNLLLGKIEWMESSLN